MFRIILSIATIALGAAMSPVSGASLLPEQICQGSRIDTICIAVDSAHFDTEAFAPFFRIEQIADTTFARMKGRSYPDNCTIARSDLRYLLIPHHDGHGNIRIGEMVCNRAIANDLIEIFKEIFEEGYPIERMVLIDEYAGDDEASMTANNTSCFNFRCVAGSRTLSLHARGMAVDINPLYNPMVDSRRARTKVAPAAGKPYVDRTKRTPYAVKAGDAAHKAFRRHGFSWGGSWRTKKDYQHFQKR